MSRYRLSPECVVVPGPDPQSATVVQSRYGSRFVIDVDLLAWLLTGRRSNQTNQTLATSTWNAAVRTLVSEQVIVDRHAAGRTSRRTKNGLGPIELAVLRGFNEGGMKSSPDGKAPPVMKRAAGRRIALTDHPEGLSNGLGGQLAARRSIRTYADRPLSRRDFEEFLQLTVRAYASLENPGMGTTSLRNYPSGGARYPLEIYPVLLNVQPFARGFYHYQPFQHQLEFLGAKARYLDALRQVARVRMSRPDADTSEPAALLVVTAVPERTCWKYEGIGLPLILQETGALYQTMYLAATGLGLAPCAIGAFPERAIAEILEVDEDEEVAVGMFALGVPGESAAAGSTLAIEDIAVRKGSPFSSTSTHDSIELSFSGGQKETIDARRLQLIRVGDTLTCPVMRGRRRGVFTGKAQAAIRRLIVERNGVSRCRIGRQSVVIET